MFFSAIRLEKYDVATVSYAHTRRESHSDTTPKMHHTHVFLRERRIPFGRPGEREITLWLIRSLSRLYVQHSSLSSLALNYYGRVCIVVVVVVIRVMARCLRGSTPDRRNASLCVESDLT